MNLKNLNEFEDELYRNLKKLKVDNANSFSHYIVHLLKSCDNIDKLEKILKNKLDCLLDKKSDEVIDIVCHYFNIKRTYGLLEKGNDDYEKNKKIQTSKYNDNDNMKYLHPTRQNVRRGSRTKKSKLKWTDIARSVKSTNVCRKMRIPCSTYREQGFCMNGDTCKFLHGKAALVKPRLVTMNSVYTKTSTEADGYPDCSTYILPERGHQDDSEDQADSRDSHKLTEHSTRNKNIITLSSDDDSNSPFIPYNSPKIYTPPSILESPLWYKELGLVEEVSSSDSSSCSNGREWKNCLIVSNIPPSMNRIGIVNKHFRKFGLLRNIEVKYGGDPKRALVEFRLLKDMLAANRSVEAVMGNRFIKTRAYKKKKSKKTLKKCKRSPSRSNKDRSRSRNSNSRSKHSRSDSKKYRRRTKSSRGHSNDIYESTNYKYKDKIIKKRLRSNTLESGEYTRNSDESTTTSVTIKPPGASSGNTRTVKIVQETDIAVTVKQESECVSTPEELFSSDPGSQAMETSDIQPISLAMGDRAISPDDSDIKLERALNDSDVDSLDSDDALGKHKRDLLIEKRRLQLRAEKQKNSVTSKLKRVSDSMLHYKSILEALILEFKSCDKSKRVTLVPKIKENHARFMQLKELHGKLNASKEVTLKRSRDPVEGQINELETNLVDRLNVSEKETNAMEQEEASDSKSIFIHVPTDIVLYQDQLQSIIGDQLEIASFDMSGYSNTSVLYVITMKSHSCACQALKTMTLSKETTNWQMSLTFKEQI